MFSPNPNQKQLVVADIAIRQDQDGRYCLNDLHKASGDEKLHQPSNWLRTDQTKSLVKELTDPQNRGSEQNQPLKVYKGGDGWQGTFVRRELVYAYAMWISPSFHIKVIRGYDTMVTQAPAVDLASMSRLELIKYAIAVEEKRLDAKRRVEELRPGAELLDRIAAAEGAFSLHGTARILQQGPNNFCAWLHELGWITRRSPNGRYIASPEKVEAGLLRNGVLPPKRKTQSQPEPDGGKKHDRVIVTPKGLALLGLILRTGNPEISL